MYVSHGIIKVSGGGHMVSGRCLIVPRRCQEGINKFSGSVMGVSNGVRKVQDGISNISG